MDEITLFLANGTFKSGSTWLREIVLAIGGPFDPVPDELSGSYKHWINLNLIEEATSNYTELRILSKCHVYDALTVRNIVSNPRVCVFHITRDPKDVIVSHYYHFSRDKIRLPFWIYFYLVGRFKAIEVYDYNARWDILHPRLFKTRFEDLKNDFNRVIYEIGTFMKIEVSDSLCEEIKNKTSIEKLREKRGESQLPEEKRFFRSGKIGDWKNHMSSRMEDIIHRINSGKILWWERLMFKVFFGMRR